MKMTAELGESTNSGPPRERKNSKETIHSGHFMVSDFEAEAQDEEGVEVPDPSESEGAVEDIQGVKGIHQGGVITYAKPKLNQVDPTVVSIDASLTKLFQTMSLAYRHNITSPKWNCFKGLRLRWKDKIRLNNVIWRCWHMQYIQKKKMTVCQFALDVDIHNRPEAVVLEGKYWKRRLNAVTAEYKKWRLFYKNRISGIESIFDQPDMSFFGLEEMEWAGSFFNKQCDPLDGNILDCDFTDMLFSPFITSPQLFPFPNPREIARGTGNSDLLQPGLIQLQPDLTDDDKMDIHEMLAGRGLPTVPEEDFFTEVEDTAGLPPSSPPSVSTPTPSTIEFNLSCTRLPGSSDIFSRPNRPSSPTFFSPHETYIPAAKKSPPRPQPAHISPPPVLPHHPQSDFTEAKFLQGKLFTRSFSSQDLRSSEDVKGPIPPPPPPVTLPVCPQGPSFAVPKSLPKKKHYGTGSFNSQVPVTGAAIVGSSTLVFPSKVSPPSNGMNSLSSEHSSPEHCSILAPLSPNVIGEVPQGSFSPNHDSALLAHLLTPEVYSPPASSPSPGSGPQSPHHSNKIRVPRITPRPYPDLSNTSTSRNGASSNSSSCSSNISVPLPMCCVNNVMTTNTNLAVSKGSSISHSPHLLPNVTLSAVTPSSIKSIQANSSGQVPHWSFSGSSICLKSSPPYPETKSPPNCIGGATSPNKPFRPKNDVERVQYKEHRRVSHINAEQKRRCNIKSNFDMLHSLIPSVNQNPNAKISKATMLHKGAEYIMQMKQERQQLSEQAEKLRSKIETLSNEISIAQSLLPATGAPVSHSRHNKINEKFESYVRDRTLQNPKYFVLALVAQSLLQSFNSSVSTASVDDLCRSSMAWLDQHCSLNVLRPVVSNAMRKLSITTNILTTPETLYEDIFRQVTKQEGGGSSNNFKISSDRTSPR